MPVSWWSVRQNRETNSLLRSDIISSGSPFSQYQVVKKTWAMSSVVAVDFVGTSRTSDPDRSVRVRIMSKPRSGGNGPMKSMATESQRWSGMGSGWSGPTGLDVRALFRWHSGQEGRSEEHTSEL